MQAGNNVPDIDAIVSEIVYLKEGKLSTNDLIFAIMVSENQTAATDEELNALICKAVHNSYNPESKCYYITGMIRRYIKLLNSAKSGSWLYIPGSDDRNAQQFSASMAEMCNYAFFRKTTLMSLTAIEHRLAEYVAVIDKSCYRLSDLDGQYIYLLLNQDCYIDNDIPFTGPVKPGTVEVVISSKED